VVAGNTLPTAAIWLITVAVLAAVELAQLLVKSQSSEATHVLTGSAGAVLGVFAARFLFANGRARLHGSQIHALASRTLLPILWMAIVIALQWWPLHFNGDPEYLRERVLAMTATSYGLAALCWNVLLGLSLGFLLAGVWPSRRGYRFPRIRIAVLAVAACSTLAAIEFGQLFIPARHPHPSDGVAGVIGAMLGLQVERITTRSGD
jgi:VanZ family protein